MMEGSLLLRKGDSTTENLGTRTKEKNWRKKGFDTASLFAKLCDAYSYHNAQWSGGT